jgi:hypothetical protein
MDASGQNDMVVRTLRATPEQWTAVRRIFKGARAAAGVGALMVLAPGALAPVSGAMPLDPLCGTQSPAAIHAPARPDYLLRWRFAGWHLVFAGQESIVPDEKGVHYVGYLPEIPTG